MGTFNVSVSPLHLVWIRATKSSMSTTIAQASKKESRPLSGAASVPGGPPPFLRLVYGYMPLVWGATLAHYLPLC